MEINPCKSTQELALDLNHIQIHNLLQLEKDRKNVKAGHLDYSYSYEDKSPFKAKKFSRISLQVTKTVSFMMIFNAKGNGLMRMNLYSLIQRQSFMKEKLCCVYGEIIML